MVDTSPPRRRSEGQTFLTGDSLYLRPLELEDAKTAMAWQVSPFPAPSAAVEERLKKQFEADHDDDRRHELIACRRTDDRPAGSVRITLYGYREATVRISENAALPLAERERIAAEIMAIVVPWLIGEAHVMVAQVWYHAGAQAVEETARSLGMDRVLRFREMLLVDGQRRDGVCWEALNPFWVRTLGRPSRREEGPVARETRSPAPLDWPGRQEEPPVNAVIVGDRLFLRPFEVEEGKLVTEWLLRETEIYYPTGRFLPNPHSYGHSHVRLAQNEPPEWPRFAICLRETGEVIGANGVEVDWVHRFAETETELFRKEHREQGYGTEAKHLLLEYAFNRLGMHMVYSWVSEANPRSAAALRKQGYRDAGSLAWADFTADGLSGGLVFDLLASEWRAARR